MAPSPLRQSSYIHPNDRQQLDDFRKRFEQALFYGTDPIGSVSFDNYDPDFVFEVNGKKYVMQEEAFPTRSLLDKTKLLHRLQELQNQQAKLAASKQMFLVSVSGQSNAYM